MRGNAYGDFFSTKRAFGRFLGEIATAAPRNDRRDCRTCARNDRGDCHGGASQGQKERNLTGWAFADMSIYNKEEGEIRLKKFFQLFLKKVLTKDFFSAILHIDNTDNTVHTVKTVLLYAV